MHAIWGSLSRHRTGAERPASATDEGRVQAAAGRASPLRAAAAAWLAARRRRPAVWLWSLLKQLFPFSYRKKVVNWMKAFAGNFGRWATAWGSHQIRWLSGSSGEKLQEHRIKYHEVLCRAGQGTWRAVALIQQSTCLSCKDLEHAKTSDDLTGAIHIFEAEPVLSTEHDEASMTLSLTGKTHSSPEQRNHPISSWNTTCLGSITGSDMGSSRFPFPQKSAGSLQPPSPPPPKGHPLGSCTRRTGASLSVGGSQQCSRSAHLTSQNSLG